MRFVRLRISPPGQPVSPVYEALVDTAAADTVRVRYGGVSEEGPRTYVCGAAGDVDVLETRLDTTDGIIDHDVLQRNPGYALFYVLSEANDEELLLRDVFTRGSMTTIPPVDLEADGSFVFRVIGQAADLQEAVADAREAFSLDVERVGDYDRPDERITAALTSRQREAIEAALSVGYYTVPRHGTHEDVGTVLGCAPSTASEHLRKAEANLVRAVFERA